MMISFRGRIYVPEAMEAADADPVKLERSYAQLAVINRTIARMPSLLRRHVLLPAARRGGSASVLEVGCGGGDVLVWLARAARADGIRLELCGLDSDARAVAHARQALASYPEARVRHASLDELDVIGESADYVLCNHVLHHLPPQEIVAALRSLRRAARRRLLISDLERSRTAYWLFSALARVAFRKSFVAEDGCLSIRKGFRVPELQAACAQADFPRASRVFRAAPWRVLIVSPADRHVESTVQFPMDASLFGWEHASPAVEAASHRST